MNTTETGNAAASEQVGKKIVGGHAESQLDKFLTPEAMISPGLPVG
jgi:hypothetical protein